MATNEEARLKSIVETAVDGIMTIDERGIIESFNVAAERLFGYSADEVIGQNVSMLMPAPYKDQHDGYLAKYIETSVKQIIGIGREVVGRRKDGSTFPMHLSVGEMWLGDQRMFTGILHDISDRKQAEERAMQAERLAAIGQMISVVTHESRNALQRSQANLEMLAMEVEDQPQAVDHIAHIQAAQDDLHHLYEELRNYAAPIHLDLEPYNLVNLAGQVLNDLTQVYPDKQVRLREQVDGVDLGVEVDPFRMHQVFRNILENSITICPNPVEINVAWSESQLADRGALQVALRDNGPGLSGEQRQKVFEPFYTTKRKGTGLGLAITRRIVEAHGGHIALGTENGGGAEFVVTLPRETLSV